jgi:hypothetical protein
MRIETASASRRATDARPPRVRSAVSNGRRLFVEGDGNSAWSRRYRDLTIAHVNDLGGRDALSEAQLSLVRRASAIECELEQMEGRLSRGETIDLDAFTRAAGHLRRILETLGLKRVARDVTPSVADYLAATRPTGLADSANGEASPRLRGREKLAGEAARGQARP